MIINKFEIYNQNQHYTLITLTENDTHGILLIFINAIYSISRVIIIVKLLLLLVLNILSCTSKDFLKTNEVMLFP